MSRNLASSGTRAATLTFLALTVLLLLGAHDRTVIAGSEADPPAATSPISAVQRLAWAYGNRDLDVYAELFTSDFRFVFSDPRLARRYPDGWTREDEIRSALHLFQGKRGYDGSILVGARAIDLDIGPVTIDSVQSRFGSRQIRVVDAPYTTLTVSGLNETYVVSRQHQRFWLVRGDSARLEPGRVRYPDRWYIHYWVENPEKARYALPAW